MSERRRALLKQKRVQQVRRQKAFLGCIGIAVIVAITVFFFQSENSKMASNEKGVDTKIEEEVKVEEAGETEKAEKAEKVEEKEETEEERLERVKMEATEAGYPKKVIELLTKNPETVEFVENYEEKKSIASPIVISEFKEGEIPKLIQWDVRWGYASYGTGLIAVCGCGPTCLSMVLSTLTGDNTLTPVKLAEYGTKNNYVTEENDTRWAFMTEACEEWGVKCKEDVLSEEELMKELDAGHPVVCSVGPGDFTEKGHFILLAGHEGENITVHDPFSIKNSNRTWTYDELKDQIRVMWIYSKKS